MSRFRILVVGLAFAVMAAAAGGCAASRSNGTTGSIYEKLPHRSTTYSAHVDQIMRAKTGYPW